VTGSHGTESIGPPLLAWAWALVAASSPDAPEFADELRPALERHDDWLARERDVHDDALITIVLPGRVGAGRRPQVRAGLRLDGPRLARLLPRDLAGAPPPLQRDGDRGPLRRACRGRPRQLNARALLALGGRFARRAERVVHALLPHEVKRALVERQLLHPRRYRAGTGIPSVAISEPSFNPRWDRFRCWRGPSWMATAWLLVPPMRELGYEAEADRVVAALLCAVRRYGLREYYDRLTGRGLGARRFAMSALIVGFGVRLRLSRRVSRGSFACPSDRSSAGFPGRAHWGETLRPAPCWVSSSVSNAQKAPEGLRKASGEAAQ
jgi:hypothetical protein